MEKSYQRNHKKLLFNTKSLRIFERSADFKPSRSLAHSLILSRINYCNALLSDAPMRLLKKLQKIQNAAARFVYGRQVDENDVIGLKCLPVRERISLSLAKLTHKALHDPSWPSYLTVRRLTLRGRNLRSESGLTVDLSGCHDGSFAKQAGNTFNELSLNIRNTEKYDTFSAKCCRYYLDKSDC